MADQREIVDWQDHYETRRRQTRRRRLIGCVILIVLLLLLLCRCQVSEAPPAAETSGNGKLQQTELVEPLLRSVAQRQKFANNELLAAPWARELYKELNRRRAFVQNCFEGQNASSFDWWFRFQPATGKILHQEFRWDQSAEPEGEMSFCIQAILQRAYRPPSADRHQQRWLLLSIRYSDDVGRIPADDSAPE
ncbi:MAG TPA: hypothetical protein VE954_07240 [Oligoflexus sp.]|uniref:hypothetical protein n=1 Tax=Oligoflexus sp. TaxID=1971216 RepID=UPI002D256BA1|nr:hypothetical protein [Oligoflexus sp.]HYX32892.1 hypothetical protein [Oligoflexus sp.]